MLALNSSRLSSTMSVSSLVAVGGAGPLVPVDLVVTRRGRMGTLPIILGGLGMAEWYGAMAKMFHVPQLSYQSVAASDVCCVRPALLLITENGKERQPLLPGLPEFCRVISSSPLDYLAQFQMEPGEGGKVLLYLATLSCRGEWQTMTALISKGKIFLPQRTYGDLLKRGEIRLLLPCFFLQIYVSVAS
jgi:hypothetical protein